MTISLASLDAFVINLDRSPDRWRKCHAALSNTLPPEKIIRVAGQDGKDFADEKFDSRQPDGRNRQNVPWRESELKKLVSEGIVVRESLPDPVRVALCVSHQRALKRFLETGKAWALIFEDDVGPAPAILQNPDVLIPLKVPDDAEIVFLHDRTQARGAIDPAFPGIATTRRGIGLEAQLVSRAGALKMIQAFRPMVCECDVQLMTFVEDYVEKPLKRNIWSQLERAGKKDFKTIKAYGVVKPLFRIDLRIPSVKLGILAEIKHGYSKTREATDPDPDEPARPILPEQGISPPSVVETYRGTDKGGEGFDTSGGIGFAVCYFNPNGYKSRLDNYVEFAKQIEYIGSSIVVVELAFDDKPFELPDILPNVIRLRSNTICWQKEALLNHGIGKLAEAGFGNVGWLDADVVFPDRDWHKRVAEVLESKRLCQCFELCERKFPDIGKQLLNSAAADWVKKGLAPTQLNNTGYGWAMNTEVWETAGLYEACIIGSGDFMMWRGVFQNYLEESAIYRDDSYSEPFTRHRREWAARWSQAIGLEVGYAPKVKVNVMSHGRMSDRSYNDRNSILRESKFDPTSHIRRDEVGLPAWTETAPPAMQRGIRRYFTDRREDSGLLAK